MLSTGFIAVVITHFIIFSALSFFLFFSFRVFEQRQLVFVTELFFLIHQEDHGLLHYLLREMFLLVSTFFLRAVLLYWIFSFLLGGRPFICVQIDVFFLHFISELNAILPPSNPRRFRHRSIDLLEVELILQGLFIYVGNHVRRLYEGHGKGRLCHDLHLCTRDAQVYLLKQAAQPALYWKWLKENISLIFENLLMYFRAVLFQSIKIFR
mmetsp:Transcript_33947/g.33095  ORF Transcript_33947/g.33095 Transcript_33947/m.33095 type:complete len:210 (-) Transcript_33947:2040-2669(-)